MESTGCDVCEGNDLDIVRMEEFTDSYSGQVHRVVNCVCRRCGHVFVTPRMTKGDVAAFYRTQYRESFQIPRGEKIGLFKQDMDLLNATLGEGAGRTALEVGCYTGYMLKRLADQGWSVEGVEPNIASAQEAKRKFGFHIHEQPFEDLSQEECRQFDLIVMGSVLEHVNSPARFVRKARGMLVEGGALFIRVPDIEKIPLTLADAFPVEHPQTFSALSLSLLCKRHGFRQKTLGGHAGGGRHLVTVQEKAAGEMPYPERPEEAMELSAYDLEQGAENREQVVARLEEYDRNVSRARRRADALLNRLWSPKPRKVAVYGAGTHTEFLLRYTGLKNANVACVLDSNPKRWGGRFLGMPIQSPNEVAELDVDAVVISSHAFHNEMRETMEEICPEGIEVLDIYQATGE